MGRKSKYTYEIKIKAAITIINRESSIRAAAQTAGASDRRVREWVSVYKSMGEGGLRDEGGNKRYPEGIKRAAAGEYRAGSQSLQGICKKYQIKSSSQLREWIKKYNGCERFKTTYSGVEIVAKGRKTTFEERVEIVKACIERGGQYNTTAEAYGVSYQQVWVWTKKYKETGIEGLCDRRGKRKEIASMDEAGKLRAENRRLRMENDLLKKLAELERGDV